MGNPDRNEGVRAYTSAAAVAEDLILRAARSGSSKDQQVYDRYARDLGTLMAQAIASQESTEVIGFFMALADTVGIAVGNIIINTDQEVEPFLTMTKEMVAEKINHHTKEIIEAAAKLRGAAHG